MFTSYSGRKICILVLLFIFAADSEAKTGRLTYYNLGLTACGTWHSNEEFVAAVGRSYWTTANPNIDPMCQKTATVTDPSSGKSVTVAIKDICGSCTANDIDLSPSAFKALRPLDVGMFTANWDFIVDGSQCYGTVKADALNIRSAPNSQSSVIGSLPNGRTVLLQSRHPGESIGGNDGWFFIGNGYVAGYYLTLSEPRPDWCY
jgi:hypothetical protein